MILFSIGHADIELKHYWGTCSGGCVHSEPTLRAADARFSVPLRESTVAHIEIHLSTHECETEQKVSTLLCGHIW